MYFFQLCPVHRACVVPSLVCWTLVPNVHVASRYARADATESAVPCALPPSVASIAPVPLISSAVAPSSTPPVSLLAIPSPAPPPPCAPSDPS